MNTKTSTTKTYSIVDYDTERHPKHYEVSWSNLAGKTFLLISKDMPNHWKFLVDLLEYEGYKKIDEHLLSRP